MEALRIEETNDTPRIIFDPENNHFEISNRSIPEDAIEFYEPVMEWLNKYSENSNPVTHFDFKLDYFNTASSKQIIQVILILEKISQKKDVVVNWHYRDYDEDMLAIGEEYSQLVEAEFKFTPVV